MSTKEHVMQIIAGPCSAESRLQIIETAEALNSVGIKTMRAGLWKPRSRFGCFEGVGSKGIPWLNEVQRSFQMKVMTEVALPAHVEASLNGGIDALWIGARTTVNPFMITELSEALKGVQIPIYIKNPVCPDLALWLGSVERLLHAGVSNLRLIHRGFCLYDNGIYRNTPLWDLANKVKEEFHDMPLFCDPSHIAGKKELILPLCRQAVSQKYDGLFIESHIHPAEALSDAKQQVTPRELDDILNQLW